MTSNGNLCIINVVGARPNFMKIAPLMAAYQNFPEIKPVLVHTGQHYEASMSHLFFDQLQIPRPDVNLEVGSGSHAVQTAEIMRRFEPVIQEHNPDLVLVVGDVNSTIACALVAAKLGVQVAHVEAGLRSFDRRMPEEINRMLTDTISDYLFVSEPSGLENLRKEGVAEEKVFFVGNVMIDTLIRHLQIAKQSQIINHLDLNDKDYAVITLHRPANVDDPAVLEKFIIALEKISRQLPIVFPAHPRTKNNLARYGLLSRINQLDPQRGIKADGGLWITEPLGYLDFLRLMSSARVVLTDSGGIQEETTFLKVPCLTLRDNTERPITVETGTNILVGTDPEVIPGVFAQIMAGSKVESAIPPLWDGHAAERIVEILRTRL